MKAKGLLLPSSSTSNIRTNCVFLLCFCIALLMHASYITHLPLRQSSNPTVPVIQGTSSREQSGPRHPQVLVFRRSKKTGSSSMLTAIAEHVEPLGYKALYFTQSQMIPTVRAESLKANPRRLFITQHNRVNRNTTNGMSTIIADTVSDGYRQVTSFCRYFRKVKDCGDEMAKCMERSVSMNKYRWAGNEHEDASTFIDLPLSSAHPALSTTVFRHVFEDAILDVPRVNVVGSSCDENPILREIYKKLYKELEEQVITLRLRLLAMAGYPNMAEPEHNITVEQMMDAAEELERKKYKLGAHQSKEAMSDKILEWWRNRSDWVRSPSTGEIVLKPKGTKLK